MLRFVLPCLFLMSLAASMTKAQEKRVVEFNRDIRPILSNNCFVCHGPDNNLRKADLRLDLAKHALEDRGGYKVLVAGKPAESEFFKRLITEQRSKRMPPPKSNKQLTPAQIELVRLWIEQGADYQQHWSLVPPKRRELPTVADKNWPRNAIDHFILHKIEQEQLRPAAEADRRTLLRRLSFDITGLPPSEAEVKAFIDDNSPNAYEKQVDRLLASPHYGERMAVYWLDLVRYADTNGYHGDNHRDVYLYRDWVIDAFNKNLPFDRFTIEQIAGDLVKESGNEQKVASGYNRLLQTTREGGAQAREYQAKYDADRVRNFSTVWLGLTLGCTECHDHKYDPFSTQEFYQLAAFFADIQETAVGAQPPTKIISAEQRAKLEQFDAEILKLQQIMGKKLPELLKAMPNWEEAVTKAPPKELPKNILAIVKVDRAKRDAKQKQALAQYYRSIDPDIGPLQNKLDALNKQRAAYDNQIPTTLVTTARSPRTVRVLSRGNWLDDSGKVVQPDTPESLPGLEFKGKRASRLELAKWLVDGNNPLTARVFANRLWSLYFGQGIVTTQDDFGSQGAWPTHLDLLDWLALEFQDSGWDVKKLIKLMVMSNTYRQVSDASAELRQRDPFNYLYAHQARYRLSAEFLRDNALAVSGLLVDKVGGPSVKPYQPPGYWALLNFPQREWQKDSGDRLYRRGLYTYWCRTFLHPSMLAFDASTREECTVSRPRSNTPQQALVLLNDPTYVEAARAFAERALRRPAKSDYERLDFIFRQALQRPVTKSEASILLVPVLHKHRQQYAKDPKSADALMNAGDSPVPKDLNRTELAAWTSVTRVVMNLDEFITRE